MGRRAEQNEGNLVELASGLREHLGNGSDCDFGRLGHWISVGPGTD